MHDYHISLGQEATWQNVQVLNLLNWSLGGADKLHYKKQAGWRKLQCNRA